MREQPRQQRQLLGCGFEMPLEGEMAPYVRPWDHEGREKYPDEPKVCPGYACGLPEVLEVSHAASFKRDGELTQFCEGQAMPSLIDAISLLEIEFNRVEAWAAQNPEKK